MTADEFRARYQLLKRVTEAGVGTFHAVGPGGAVVMVHVFSGPEQAGRAQEAVKRLLPIDRTRILETLDVEGSPVLVTKFLLDFVSLESWFEERLAAAEAEGYAPGQEQESGASQAATEEAPLAATEPPADAGPVEAILPTASQDLRPPPPITSADSDVGGGPAGDAGPAPPDQGDPQVEGGLTAAFAAFQETEAEVEAPVGPAALSAVTPPAEADALPGEAQPVGALDPLESASPIESAEPEEPADPTFEATIEPAGDPALAEGGEPAPDVPGGLTAAFEAFAEADVAAPPEEPPVEPTLPDSAAASPVTSSMDSPPAEASDTEAETQDEEPTETAASVGGAAEPAEPDRTAKPEKGEFTQLFEAFGSQLEEESGLPSEPERAPGAGTPPPAQPAEPLPAPPEPVLGAFQIDDEVEAPPPPVVETPAVPPAPPVTEAPTPPAPPVTEAPAVPPATPLGPPEPVEVTPPPPVVGASSEPPLPGGHIVLPWEEELPLDEAQATPPVGGPVEPPGSPAAPPPLTEPGPPVESPPPPPSLPEPPPPVSEGPLPSTKPLPPGVGSPPPPREPGPLTRQFELGRSPTGQPSPPSDRGLFGGGASADAPGGAGPALPDISSDYFERLRSRDDPTSTGRVGGPPPPPPVATGGSAAAGSPPPPVSGGRSGPSEYSQIIKAIPLADAPPESATPPPDAPSGALAQGPSRRMVIGVVVAAVVISLMTVVALVVWRFAGPAIRRLMDEPPPQDSAATSEGESGS